MARQKIIIIKILVRNIPKKVTESCRIIFIFIKKKYNESEFVGKKGNHPLMLSIINLAIVKSTVKESLKKIVVDYSEKN